LAEIGGRLPPGLTRWIWVKIGALDYKSSASRSPEGVDWRGGTKEEGEEDHYIEVTTLFSEWEITVEIQNGGI